MPTDENPFAPLSEDEGEGDIASGDVILARPRNFKKNSRSSQVSGRGKNNGPSGKNLFEKISSGSAGLKPKKVASCCNLSCNLEFPTLPETQKMPGVSLSQEENHPTASSQTQFSSFRSQLPSAPGLPFANASEMRSCSGLIPFSDLVETILTAFNASESIKALAKMILPSVKPFVQQLAANWPILNMIISFDG